MSRNLNTFLEHPKHKGLFIVFLMSLLLLITFVSAQSNDSISASNAIVDAEKKLDLIASRNIPSDRINDSLTQAIQLYSAQMALEKTGQNADYKVVFQYLNDFSVLSENAFKAQDQLTVFYQELNKSSKDYDFSAMNAQIFELNKSFSEQRFEDTINLIDGAYVKMSEIQSSQTKLKLFYSTTTRTLTQFLYDNWKVISISLIVLVILIIVFWKTFVRWNINKKIKALQVQKKVLFELIKKLQYTYFKLGKISETEFNTRLETFKELVRDIDRKIPLLFEQLAKNKR